MVLRAECIECGREFLIQEIAAPQGDGTCPACGAALAPEYTAIMVDLARRLDFAAASLENTLSELSNMPLRFRIKPESLLDPLKEILDRQAPPNLRGAA